MKKFYTAIAALLLVVGISGSARANLVVNGSFETGDLTGWTDGGNTGWNTVSAGANAPGQGNFGISNGAVGSNSLLDQTQLLSTVAGAQYQIDFWIQNDGAGIFSVVFDGNTVYSESGISHAYTQHTVFAIASTANTSLEIQSRDDPGFLQFDAISVTQVPEPSSLALLALGSMALVGSMVRNRRRKADLA